jgi:hypothetical protein
MPSVSPVRCLGRRRAVATPRCSYKGCVGEARFRPVWLLAFESVLGQRRVSLDITVCDEHRREMRSLFGSARGRLSLARALARRLGTTPDWSRSRMWFQRIH